VKLKTTVREAGAATVIMLEGSLELGCEEICQVREMVADLVAHDRKFLLFDLQKVRYIDSVGIGMLVACFTTARKSGGTMKLLRPSSNVREVLALIRILGAFEIFEDEASAIASFTKAAAGKE
jgi:anti-sigma B factor antagonist